MNNKRKPYSIVNIIASGKIQGNFDIEKLSMVLEKVQYEPEQFPGLIYRNDLDNYTIIVFYSGKISSHGTKSIEKAKNAILDSIKKIMQLDCIIGSSEINNIQIENIVSTFAFGNSIDVENLCGILDKCKYEPDKFPGLIYKPFNDSRTVLIFHSGKMIIVGVKNHLQLNNLYEKTIEEIKKFESKRY